MKLKNANPIGGSVVASILNNINFYFYFSGNYENCVKRQTSNVVVSKRWCDFSKN
jgi:hypothetical protein